MIMLDVPKGGRKEQAFCIESSKKDEREVLRCSQELQYPRGDRTSVGPNL